MFALSLNHLLVNFNFTVKIFSGREVCMLRMNDKMSNCPLSSAVRLPNRLNDWFL